MTERAAPRQFDAMTRIAAWRPILVAVVAVLAGCIGAPLDNEPPRTCTLIGCADGVFARVNVPLAESDLQRTTVTVCLNGACSTGLGPKPGQGCELKGAVQADCFSVEPGRLQVTMYTEHPVDGDLASVRVSRPDAPSETLVLVEKKVSYATSMPNGPGCAPTCHQASLNNF